MRTLYFFRRSPTSFTVLRPLGHVRIFIAPEAYGVQRRQQHSQHPFPVGSTKEHAPSIYSERFARLGYAALAFDHTSYGDSESTPRSDEDPFVKSEDFKNAVSFLLTRPEVNPDRTLWRSRR